MELRVYPSPFALSCSNFMCRRTTEKMWFIGIPEHLGSSNVYCDHCIRAMIENLPEELKFSDQDALKQAIQNAVEPLQALIAEKNERIDFLMSELENRPIGAAIHPETPEPEQPEPEASVQSAEPEPDQEDEDAVYRCLECGKEFETESGLKAHRGKMHKGE